MIYEAVTYQDCCETSPGSIEFLCYQIGLCLLKYFGIMAFILFPSILVYALFLKFG